MKFDLASIARPIEIGMRNAAQKATMRHLTMYHDQVTCTRGCSHCCSRMVYISIAEALIIQDSLVESKKWPEVKHRCIQQKATALKTTPVPWFKMNIPCSILNPKTNECLAYEVRPTPCSTHFVGSNPKACDPWSTESHQYVSINMDDIHDEFMRFMESNIDGYSVLAYRMPIPVALLFAESVRSMVGLSLDEITSIIRSELK